MSLLAEERRGFILEQIDAHGKVRVTVLAEQLKVSQETVRRDLFQLEEEGKLKRVYGGGVKTQYEGGEPPYQQRSIMNYEAKQIIGGRAAELVQDGDTIFMDTGTTIYEMAKALKGKKQITVITNSLTVANQLCESIAKGLVHGRAILLGGELSPFQRSVSGYLCQEMLKNFYVDHAFISIGGISIDTGISDYDLNDSVISRMVINSAKEIIVLADHSKVGIQASCHLASLEKIDVIVSDKVYPSLWEAELERQGITWITADHSE
ncbi:DeoR family transcriptional regulator [Bacillus sp. FJAT-27264]|uniref:DeoR/GlpR family DNA-binding transcription regulator n=1 Tax=Paenibacillus sp. (strain DSM 101736 / FJAT-27264) TaxID=1850362 RepID=UPI000807EE6D|nr:DeoR/GlpR family DNA-binding transcription regulator [Bacillus sp. FJAT-27264]OBZ14718.1 DeoR family transcriptional regulator [Bacillus sp. FJAT-27264]